MSLRLTTAKVLARLFVKPRLRKLEHPEKARKEFERAAEWLFRAPPFAWYRDVTLVGNLSAIWVETRPASRPAPFDKVILYLHGGGFIAGSPKSYRKILARLSWLTGMKVCAPDYRKAPEHPFPAAVQDCVAAYKALLSQGYLAKNIILAGDSAGGGLVFSVLAMIEGRLPQPRAIVAFSPIVDLRFKSLSFEENREKDPLLPPERRDIVLRYYLKETSADDTAASPILHGFHNPPPTFFQYSSTEILRDESRRMADVLRAAGGKVEQDEWPDAPHVWIIFDGWIPESREALKRAAKFINQQFQDEKPSEN